MKTAERRIIASVVICGIAASGASVFENPHALALELRRIETSIKEGHRQGVEDTLPLAWVVSSNKRDYPILTAPLKSELESKDDAAAVAWLEQTAEQLEIDSPPPNGRSTDDARADLSRILSRREFADIRPPSPWERFKAWLQSWIVNLLGRLFGFAGPSAGRIIWGLGAVAVVFLAFRLYQTLRKGTQSSMHLTAAGAQPLRTWEQWVSAAREAFAQDDFRTAAHAAYWAGVSHLQDERVLPADISLTAREYLRLIPENRRAHDSFAVLTSGLERFWYANRPATSAEVQELFGSMEALGCRPD
ncbi:MAG TPA: DUF4129 domain-containing protein [Bryobacteraceae bacterium]|nr:DUF4129 domain-containing protein [Bryobacteraceae bacterium]